MATLLKQPRWLLILVGTLIVLTLAALGSWWAYENIPGVHYRVQVVWAQAFDAVVPQVDVLPTVAGNEALPTINFPTRTPLPATVTPTAAPRTSPIAAAQVTPTIEPTATLPPASPTAIPDWRILGGIKHEKQYFNNCGPATMAFALSYWGWKGNQLDISAMLRPNQDDKNVSPAEFQTYLQTAGFDSVVRVNGDAATLERFIAAGYPVVIEKGLTCESDEERCSGWVGHYSLVIGYNGSSFTLQDSFRGAGIKLFYHDVLENWRAFNYVYIVPFPADDVHRAEVMRLLGSAAEVDENYREALTRAQEEAANSKWSAAAFAWFNVGTNLVALGDYANAALAFDQARKAGISPHMLWYQFGLYQAYYETGRYDDLIHFTSFAIDKAHLTGLEESYYWRGKGYEATQQRNAAIKDYRSALTANPTYQLAQEALKALGETP